MYTTKKTQGIKKYQGNTTLLADNENNRCNLTYDVKRRCAQNKQQDWHPTTIIVSILYDRNDIYCRENPREG